MEEGEEDVGLVMLSVAMGVVACMWLAWQALRGWRDCRRHSWRRSPSPSPSRSPYPRWDRRAAQCHSVEDELGGRRRVVGGGRWGEAAAFLHHLCTIGADRGGGGVGRVRRRVLM